MSEAEVRTKTPKLIAIALILSVIAAGVTFSFQKESSMLRGFLGANIRGLLSGGEEDEEAVPEEHKVKKHDAIRPNRV